jgi:hypothetical protein
VRVDLSQHDCDIEYWRHCHKCVAGDPDAAFEELRHDYSGLCVEIKISYPDGSEVVLERGLDGWRFPEAHYTDCATATGMYDP